MVNRNQETAGACILGLIPARGGSKGIPRKALRLLAGKPLIAWTIAAALESGVLGRVVVTTDDTEIAATARRLGAEAPFLRPRELALDSTPMIDAVVHAMDALAAAGDVPDWVMLLQPTSPLRGPEDIRAAAAFTLRSDVESVISVCEAVPPPEWTKRMTPEGWLEDVFPHETPGARQQLVTSYVPNGAIYLARSRVLRARHSFYAGHTHGYIMPRERSVDIDTPWDLEIAEAIIARGTRGPR